VTVQAPTFGRRAPVAASVITAPEPVAPVAVETEPVKALVRAPSAAIAELRVICLARLEPAAVAAMPHDLLTADMEKLVSEIASERRVQLNGREQRALASELVHDIVGLGPLEPLLEDDSINDIMVNGPDKTFIERRGKVVRANVQFRDAMHLANICQRIAAAVGRRVDESSPMVDARLADGSRVNIVFMPLALDGPYLSIRKFGKKTIDFDRLIEFGAMTRQVAKLLQIAGRARLNVIISGGTGSGKTTLMNAMSRMIDPAERIVTVEDAAELQLQQPHVVRMETRPASLEGKGEITQRDLVRNALRMRPDRIIIGEVRAGEAFDMLQAMNTGHDGSMSTIHANTTRDALTRVENMVQMGNMGLPSRAIRTQIAGAVDLIVQVERQRDGGRRVTQVTEICGMEGDVITMNDIFQFEVVGEGPDGKLFGRYKVSRVPAACQQRLAYFGLEQEWKNILAEADA
jgi:pilus assembly protein CpaF